MFTWVGAKFDAILNSYVFGVVSSLITNIAPIALVAFTLWVFFYGWAVMRNEVSETVPVFVWKVFKIMLVMAFCLQAGIYMTTVSDTANGLAMGVASTFLPASVDPTTVTSPYALLDKFNDQASMLASEIMKEGSMFRLDLVLSATVFSIGAVIFLCVGLFVVTLAKVLLAFVIAVGPLFILCLAWKPTVRFFDSWLSRVLNTVVLTWFSFCALGLTTYMGEAIFQAIHDGGGFLGPTFNVLGESIRFCVLMIFMAIICFQAPTLAAALTGGAVVQQGFQMIQNAMIAGGLRSPASRPGVGGMAGGVVQGGVGLPYRAGHAAGTAARQAAGATKIAAYKLAAMRGRR